MCFLDSTWFRNPSVFSAVRSIRSGQGVHSCSLWPEEIQLFPPGGQWHCDSAPSTFSKAVIQWYHDSNWNAKNAHLWSSLIIFAYQDVNWLTGLNEPPQDVLDLLEFFLSRVTGTNQTQNFPRARGRAGKDVRYPNQRYTYFAYVLWIFIDHVYVDYIDIMDRYMISWISSNWFWLETGEGHGWGLQYHRWRWAWMYLELGVTGHRWCGNCWEIDVAWCWMRLDDVSLIFSLYCICFAFRFAFPYFDWNACWSCPVGESMEMVMSPQTANGARLTLREFERGLSSMDCRGPQREVKHLRLWKESLLNFKNSVKLSWWLMFSFWNHVEPARLVYGCFGVHGSLML